MEENTLEKFIQNQLSVWPMASANFRSLKEAREREMEVGGITVRIQHNPQRIISTTSAVNPEAIAARPCFLCVKNRPKEQFHQKFEGRKGRSYNIQVNPYPIFPKHLVIARDCHKPQSIWHCFVDFLDLARECKGYTIFYNGPASGASAPDHMHFQACQSGILPLEVAVDSARDLEYVTSVRDADLYHFPHFTTGVFVLRATTSKSIAKLFYRFLDAVPVRDGESEPRFNLFCWHTGSEYRALVVLRSEPRSHHYSSEGPDHLTMSPGCADMAGFFVVPMAGDFEKLDSGLLGEMLSEVSVPEEEECRIISRLTRSQSTVDVGIMSAKEIVFEIISDGAGRQKVSWENGRINYNGILYDELHFDAQTMSTLFAEPSFILEDVTIGVDFHWERKQEQRFAGSLKFVVEGEWITAVNTVGVEDYLLSVISSEMKATASLEFLKAHAVISRSWLMAQIGRRSPAAKPHTTITDTVYISWQDHQDHSCFDVCADDHCQRYQGLSVAVGENVRKAIDLTWGQVLKYDGQICDARFHKCCGGRTEIFSTCWEERDYPYLSAVEDPFCDCENKEILSTVLNDYDTETNDFHDWTVKYTRNELSRLISSRLGMDLGEVRKLEAVETGPSGRIKYLRITGTERTVTIGKELLIRKALSDTHLKSSAFTVSVGEDTFVLKGRGWGHGVGLCQIGAAVMASKGYNYRQILNHYYTGAEISE